MAEKHLVTIDACRRHRTQPIEMRLVELRMHGPVPGTHLLRRPVDQIAVVIAEHVYRIERHQRIHRAPRIKRAARHVAEIDDLVDALRADVGNDSFQREIVSVHIGNRGKTHQ